MDNYKTTLETERLTLRPPTMDDFEAFHSWGSNPVTGTGFALIPALIAAAATAAAKTKKKVTVK
jgi:RimJ/RimL family protein N-acetyltransferase